MSNDKQSSVVDFIENEIRFKISNSDKLIEIFEQAKSMHQKEHNETFNAGVQWVQYQRDLINGGTEYWEKYPPYFPEYYNETFGSAE